MSNDRYTDPVSPRLTFDSYVIPETVQEYSTPRADVPGINGTIVAVSIIAVLTFLLGIMTTLQFMGPRQIAQAETATKSDLAQENGEVLSGAAPSASSLANLVEASVEQDVTRYSGTDLITPTGAMSRAQPGQLSMSEILKGLSPTPAPGDPNSPKLAGKEDQDILNRNKLRMLREGVLAGTFSVKVVKRNGKQRLCLRMPNANVSQDEAADLIRQAAANGEIELPESLSTEDGDFDADTLIFNLVQTSLAQDGTPEGAEAAREMSRRAFAASSAKTSKVKGERIYVVESGDSLAYISLQFYGRPSEYERIFEANRSVLKSPDRIQIGQRLIIPG